MSSAVFTTRRVEAFIVRRPQAPARVAGPLSRGGADLPAPHKHSLASFLSCPSPPLSNYMTETPRSATFEIDQLRVSLGDRFKVPGIETQSLSSVAIASWDSPNTISRSPTYHISPTIVTPEILDVVSDISDPESEPDADSDSDSEAQYITILPGSPWYKPPSECLSSSSSRGSSRRPSSNTDSRLPADTCAGEFSPTPLPSALFLRSPQTTTETLRLLYCQEFARTILRDLEDGDDQSYLEEMDLPLLLNPQKAFENVFWDSLIQDSRHRADVPVDLSDEDEGDEWEFWDQNSSQFIRRAPWA